MTLADDAVQRQLNHTFVPGWVNIKGKKGYSGNSNSHMPTWAAKTVNSCSGHHNVQMFFMTKEGKVHHCLPGYWEPKDFLEQVQFAVKLAKVYYTKRLTNAERNEKFLDMHLQKAYGHHYALSNGSQLQGFDVNHVKKKTTDFERKKGFIGGIKRADQVVHERMAERPFVSFEKFDTKQFINLGIKRYKYDFGVPGKDKYGYGPKASTRTRGGKTKSGKYSKASYKK